MSETKSAREKKPHCIEIKLREVGQLFNSLDPAPFHEKDLDRNAEEYIESSISEFPREAPVELRIYVQQFPAEGDPTHYVQKAIHNFFEYKARLSEREFKRLMKQGQISLLIGLLFLGLCLIASKTIGQHRVGTLYYILSEGLVIAGWVAMWRPMEIYLYEWWPFLRRIKVLRKMSKMPVEVRLLQ